MRRHGALRTALLPGILSLLVLAVLSVCGCSLLPGSSSGQSSSDNGTSSTSTGQSTTTSSGSVSGTKTEGTLTVGLLADSLGLPYCSADENGNVEGLDVDLGAALADQMGLSVTYKVVSNVSNGLSSCDVVMSSTESAAQKADATICGSYDESACGFFCRGEFSGTVSKSDLTGMTVAVQEGSSSASTLSKSDLNMNTMVCSSSSEAFSLLVDGTVDYVLCDAYLGAYLAANQTTKISFAGAISDPETMGVAVASSNSELASAVTSAFEAVKSNGKLDVIRSTWVGSFSSLTSSSKVSGVTTQSTTTTTDSSTMDGSHAGANAVVADGSSSSDTSDYGDDSAGYSDYGTDSGYADSGYSEGGDAGYSDGLY